MPDILAIVGLVAAKQSAAMIEASHPPVDYVFPILVFTTIIGLVVAYVVQRLLALVCALLAAINTLLRGATALVMAGVATTTIIALLLVASGTW